MERLHHGKEATARLTTLLFPIELWEPVGREVCCLSHRAQEPGPSVGARPVVVPGREG